MLRYTILFVCVLFPIVYSKYIQPVTCGPVCDIYCQYGNVLDANGCPTCRCKKSPCEGGKNSLAGYFCGRGPNRKDCPYGYNCVIAPNDAYAVCCPDCKQPVTKTTPPIDKPGSCPPQYDQIGSCLAECSNDNDCDGKLKCCGNCPRKCVKPVY